MGHVGKHVLDLVETLKPVSLGVLGDPKWGYATLTCDHAVFELPGDGHEFHWLQPPVTIVTVVQPLYNRCSDRCHLTVPTGSGAMLM